MSLTKKNIYIKISVAAFGLLVGLCSQLIIPKSLTVEEYGAYSYTIYFYQNIIMMTDLGFMSYFFNSLSRDNKNYAASGFYVSFVIINIIFILIISIISLFDIVRNAIFIDISRWYIILGAAYGTCWYINMVIEKFLESHGEIILSEKSKVYQKTFFLILILFVYILDYLSFISIVMAYFMSILIQVLIIYVDDKSKFFDDIFKRNHILSIFDAKMWKIYISYSLPVLTGILIGTFGNLFDRWILQKEYGSVEQSYLGVAQMVVSFGLIGTTAIISLLWRELSDFKNNNKIIFKKTVNNVFFMSIVIGSILISNIDIVLSIIDSGKYIGAKITLIILSLNIAYQSVGQVSSILYLSANKTKEYSLFAIISVLFSIVMIYYLIDISSNRNVSGAALISFKLLIVNIIFVNIQLFSNFKYLGINFLKFIKIQITLLALLFLNIFIQNIFFSMEIFNINYINRFFISLIFIIFFWYLVYIYYMVKNTKIIKN